MNQYYTKVFMHEIITQCDIQRGCKCGIGQHVQDINNGTFKIALILIEHEARIQPDYLVISFVLIGCATNIQNLPLTIYIIFCTYYTSY